MATVRVRLRPSPRCAGTPLAQEESHPVTRLAVFRTAPTIRKEAMRNKQMITILAIILVLAVVVSFAPW